MILNDLILKFKNLGYLSSFPMKKIFETCSAAVYTNSSMVYFNSVPEVASFTW